MPFGSYVHGSRLGRRPDVQLLRPAAEVHGRPERAGPARGFLRDGGLSTSLNGLVRVAILAKGLDDHPEAVTAIGARKTWFREEDYARRDAHSRIPKVRDIRDELLFGLGAVSGQNPIAPNGAVRSEVTIRRWRAGRTVIGRVSQPPLPRLRGGCSSWTRSAQGRKPPRRPARSERLRCNGS